MIVHKSADEVEANNNTMQRYKLQGANLQMQIATFYNTSSETKLRATVWPKANRTLSEHMQKKQKNQQSNR